MTVAGLDIAAQLSLSHLNGVSESLGRSAPGASDEVAKGFEEILLRQLLRETRKSSFTTESLSSSIGGYTDLMDDYLSQLLVNQGGIGLASTYAGQLSEQIRLAKLIDNSNPAVTIRVEKRS